MRQRHAYRMQTFGWRFSLLMGLAACSPDPVNQPGPKFCEVVDCSRECEAMTVRACDISESACRRLVQKSVECVRGIDFDETPNVRVVRRDSSESSAADAGSELDVVVVRTSPLEVSLPSDATLVSHHFSSAMKAFELLSGDLNFSQALVAAQENVAGRYWPGERELEVLIAEDAEQWTQMRTLAHEMIHALQDQERDLDSFYQASRARGASSNSTRAFVEGEAQLYAMLSLMFMLDGAVDVAERWVHGQKKGLLRSLRSSDAAGIDSIRRLVYPAGAIVHLEHWKRAGSAGTDELSDSFPLELAGWMRGDDDVPKQTLSCDDLGPLELSDMARVGAARTGPELVLPLLVRTVGSDLAFSWQASSEVTGDCLEVYGRSASSSSLGEEFRATAFPELADAGPGFEDAGRPRAVPARTIDAGAQADAASSASRDAGDGGASPLIESFRLTDVSARWVIDFADTETARRAVEALETLSEVDVERDAERVTLFATRTSDNGYESPLSECWPLYPFDPDEVYVVQDRIWHWSNGELALGTLPAVARERASISVAGELVYDERLFTPNRCLAPTYVSNASAVEADAEDDPVLAHPCDSQSVRSRQGAQGETFFECGRSEQWVTSGGEALFDPELGELLSIGYQKTLLLDTGVLHLSDGDSDVVLPFDVPGEWLATKARPDGYWVVAGSEDGSADLWFVDLLGEVWQLATYSKLEAAEQGYALIEGAVDGSGAFYQSSGGSLLRRDPFGDVQERDVPARGTLAWLVTGP